MLLYRKQIFIRKKGKCDYKVNSNNSCNQSCCHSIPYCIRSSIVMTSPPPSPPNGRRQVMCVGRREMPSISFLNMDGSHPPLIPPSPLLSSPPILPFLHSPLHRTRCQACIRTGHSPKKASFWSQVGLLCVPFRTCGPTSQLPEP